MSKTYFYIPFPAKNLNDPAVAGSKSSKIIVYSNLSIFDADGKYEGQSRGHFIERNSFLGISRGVRPLSVVGSKDVLEISAHGLGDRGQAVNSTMLAANVDVPGKSGGIKGTSTAGIKAEWVAQRLMKDGLTKSITDVRLMVCYSGLEHGHVFDQLVHPGLATAADCLASLLARAMGQLGYKSVVVSGATGEVMGDEVFLGGSNSGMKGYFYFGSRHFDSRGQRVSTKVWNDW